MAQDLLPGTEVHARGLRWEIVLTERLGQQTLYRLRGVEGAVQGTELDLLHPFEPIDPIVHELQPDKAAPFQNWLIYHQAFLLEQALGSDALLAVQPGRLRVEPYQLVPVLRAIRMSRPRLLLADGVGLGKTIQAGLVLTELMARRIAHRVLIVSPAGPLLQQWKTEMLERFGLRLDVITRTRLDEIRKGNELGVNPFDHIPLGLVSIDFIKQDNVLDQLERTTYDVVIIDEAHHCMDVGSSTEREDSQRRKLAQVLAKQCDALLMLTATPHDGTDRSFAFLCETLDPSLVDGRGVLRGDQFKPYVVRRLKGHIRDPQTGEERFKKRIVIPCPVDVGSEKTAKSFVDLHRALLDVIAPELRKAMRARRYSDVLSFISLLKRSVSTVAALRSTLHVVKNRYDELQTAQLESKESKQQRLRSLREYHRKLERYGSATQEEEDERSFLEAEDVAQSLAVLQKEIRSGTYHLKRTSDVAAGLEELVALADAAIEADPKLEAITDLIRDIRKEKPKANILIYTEYTTSQSAIEEALKKVKPSLGTILTMSGDDDDDSRDRMTDRFRRGEKVILVSTDAAAEGLNLHQRCHHLIHVELPFNPNRLEQRNGRIDRYGQTENPVVRYLYLRGTFEERILLRLIAKYERQRSTLTFVPNTLGMITSSEAMGAKLLKGFVEEEAKLFKDEQGELFDFESRDEADGADEATKELLEEIDRSLKGFRDATKTNSWLGDQGLNADESLLEKADEAHERGIRESRVDLGRFVANAVLMDGGDVEEDGELISISLPPTWLHGLDDLPGYDGSTRRLLLTTDMNVMSDAKDRSVGFLGRAHPLVRRAIDRVRNLSFGGAAVSGLDARVSAMQVESDQPAILLTYLGRVSSKAGRELERVIALKYQRDGSISFFAEPAEWLAEIEAGVSVSPKDLWEKRFKNWAADLRESARIEAYWKFHPLADEFRKQRLKDLAAEQAQLQAWIQQRADDVTGDVRAVQDELFEKRGEKQSKSSWLTADKPFDRLAGCANDDSQPAARRSEADGVLRIYNQRMEHLSSKLDLEQCDVAPLGMIMLTPGKDTN